MTPFRRTICFLSFMLFGVFNIAFAHDFVTIGEADVVVITHHQLLTPGWPESRENAWESQLLEQKAAQGFSVALLQLTDNINQDYIRNYLLQNQGSFRYVLIIGDARRPENDPPNPMALSVTNFSDGNIVPIWREVITNPHYWPPNYANICESDQGYIAGIPNVTIGRIPAETPQEINDYLTKADRFIAEDAQSWSHRILEVLDDVFHYYNFCSGGLVRDYTETSEQEFPLNWPITRLATSTASTDTVVRFAQFESEFNNNTPGFIHVLGTSGRADDLVNWYYGSSSFGLSNSHHLPLMVAMSCDLGGFDQYYDGVQKQCVIERLLLMPEGGIIAAVVPTGVTIQTINGVFCKYFWRTIFTDGVMNFGSIISSSIERTRGRVPSEDFILNSITLLGDPTLSLQLTSPRNATIYSNGSSITLRWDVSFSPCYRIYSSDNPGGPFNALEGTTTENFFTITNWSETGMHYFRVVGWDGNP